MEYRSDERRTGMRKKDGKTPRKVKSGTQRRIRTTALVLLVLSYLVLLFFNVLYDIFRNIEEATDRFQRLYESAARTASDTNFLTNNYDAWQYSRLDFLNYVSEQTDDPMSEQFVANGIRLTDRKQYALIDMKSGSVLESRIDDFDRSAIPHMLAAVNSSENRTGLYADDNYRYYCRILAGDRLGVLRTDMNVYREILDNIYTPAEIVDRNLGDQSQFVLTLDADGNIQQFYDQEAIGKPFETCFKRHGGALLDRIEFNVNEALVASYKGNEYVLISGELIDFRIKIYYGFSLTDTVAGCLNVILPIAVLMAVMTVLFRAYTYYLIIDRHLGRPNVREGIRFKAFVFALLSLVITVAGAYFIKTMDGLSYFIGHYRDVMDDIRYVSDDSELCEKDLRALLDDEGVKEAQLVSNYLSAYPEKRTEQTLKDLCSFLGQDRIILFDTQGVETLCNENYIGVTISEGMDSSFAKFNPLRYGVSPIVGDFETDPLDDLARQTIGVTTKDANGDVDGFLLMSHDPVTSRIMLENTRLGYLLDNSVVTDYYECFMISQDTGLFTYASDSKLIGQSATSNGFDEKNLRNHFSEYLTVDNVEYFMSSSILKNDYLYIGIPVERIFRLRKELCLQVLVFMSLILLIIAVMERRCVINPKDLPSEESAGRQPGGQDRSVILMSHDDLSLAFSPIRRYKKTMQKWPDFNAEEKLGTLGFEAMFIISLVFSVGAVIFRQLFGSSSLYNYIMAENWPRGFNAFSVSAMIMLSVLVLVIVYFLRVVLQLIGNVLTPRAETICNVLSSFLKYASVIGLLYMALNYFGVDVRALSASVGFMALIIGFGARSLITDIIAGVFIIFEKEFQVGDIVEIGGYRGMVIEIGLRTTKLLSWDKNVKILNNHDVSNVINLSMQNSYAVVNFTMPVRNSIEQIEEVFNRELPLLRAKYPNMLSDPIFAGVLSFSGSHMACRIYVEVEELWRGRMISALHKELQDICSRNNILLE